MLVTPTRSFNNRLVKLLDSRLHRIQSIITVVGGARRSPTQVLTRVTCDQRKARALKSRLAPPAL